MRVLIGGGGRSCTCWVFSLFFKTDLKIPLIKEDRDLPERMDLEDGYCCKLCIENDGVTLNMFQKLMREYDDLFIIWCLKHPLSQALAKIHRGTDKEKMEPRGIDAPKEAACEWVRKSWEWYEALKGEFPRRVTEIRLEDLVLDGVNAVRKLFAFIGADIDDETADKILHSYTMSRNPHHRERYKEIDQSQACIHENVETAFDGWFADKTDWVDYVKGELSDLIEGYE